MSARGFGDRVAAPLMAGGYVLASLGAALAHRGAVSAGRALMAPGASLLRTGFSLKRTPPHDLTRADEVRDMTVDDGLRIRCYRWGDAGDATPVLLQHGFAANAHANWVYPGVVAALRKAGRQVFAVDARGHGASEAPHDPARYGEARMARDLIQVVDALRLAKYDLVGYSMGAVTALLAAARDSRIRRLVVGGIGEAMVDRGGVDTRVFDPRVLADDLELERADLVTQPGSLLFRLFAERMGADRHALAAQARAFHQQPIALSSITVPTLVIAGKRDALARNPRRLAQALSDGEFAIVPGDHLGAAASPELTRALVGFLVQ